MFLGSLELYWSSLKSLLRKAREAISTHGRAGRRVKRSVQEPRQPRYKG